MSFSKVWEEIHSKRIWGRYPKEDVVRWVARNYYSHPERWRVNFLDLGCGSGATSWYLKREGFSCVGIDGSPSAVAHLGSDGVVGDVVNLPFDDNSFDCVIDVACICHNEICDAKDIVNEAHRVLKPKGRIFSVMPTDSCARQPYDGKGKVIFLNEHQVADLFSPEFVTEVNWTGFSERSYTVYHWLISGIKVGA
jgi:SAM-dependent methyltransferase